MDEIETAIREFVLQNAIFYKGKAQSKAVMGKIATRYPELKKEFSKYIPVIERIVAEVNALDLEAQKRALETLAPELLVKKEKGHEYRLPPLKLKPDQKVVMRLAPFPSGAPHIGNLRSFILNDEYVKQNNGTLYLIFDDTIGSEEKMVLTESYELIKNALEWLGIKFERIFYKSDRMEIYYDWGRKLLEAGHAYVCFCDAETLRKNREEERECAHRNVPSHQQLEYWSKMLGGGFAEGEVCVRIKTDMRSKDPAFRDRVLFRISYKTHPRIGKKYCVWPLLEMTWAIDDYLLGITHILRGKDLVMEDEMEKAIWSRLGLEPEIEFIHFGMLRVEDAKISKSKAMKEVLDGTYIGWHDPRTWSVQSLRTRGFKPEAIRRFIITMGMSLADISVPAENVYSFNRSIIDPEAPRVSFIGEPVKLVINGLPDTIREVKAPIHPEFPERGSRTFTVSDEILIEKNDHDLLQGQELRLKDFCNIVLESQTGRFTSTENKSIPRIHWLNANDPNNCKVDIMMIDGTHMAGIAEPALKTLKLPAVVQFERFGFVTVDAVDDNGIFRVFFAHK